MTSNGAFPLIRISYTYNDRSSLPVVSKEPVWSKLTPIVLNAVFLWKVRARTGRDERISHTRTALSRPAVANKCGDALLVDDNVQWGALLLLLYKFSSVVSLLVHAYAFSRFVLHDDGTNRPFLFSIRWWIGLLCASLTTRSGDWVQTSKMCISLFDVVMRSKLLAKWLIPSMAVIHCASTVYVNSGDDERCDSLRDRCNSSPPSSTMYFTNCSVLPQVNATNWSE